MKREIFLGCILCALVGLLSFQTIAMEANSGKESEGAEKKQAVVFEITGEENIREYLEANGEVYDPKLVAVKQILYVDDIISKEEISQEATRGIYEYYITNLLTVRFTDTSFLLREYSRPAGHVKIAESVQIANTFSAGAGVPVDFVELQLGYSVTATNTFAIEWEATYDYPVIIRAYPIYEQITGTVWEDDVWEDDLVGSFTAKRALGDEVRVYQQ